MTEPEYDPNLVRDLAGGLNEGIGLYVSVMAQGGTPIRSDVLISALMTVLALYLDTTPLEWRREAISKLAERCGCDLRTLN